MKYYYPSNMEAPPLLGLWTLRDIFIFGLAGAFSLILYPLTRSVIPLAITAFYAFMTVTFDDISIFKYLSKLCRYFITQQLVFYWEKEDQP